MNRSFALLGTIVFLFGCIQNPQQSTTETPPQQEPTTPDETHEEPAPEATHVEEPIDLNPFSPNVVYADGWRELIINANSAKTVIDVGAHFSTSRNACGKDAFGAIDLKTWNTISQNMNAIVASTPRAEDQAHCVDLPSDTMKWMDGYVDIKLPPPQKVRTIFEYKNGQICSTIQDTTVSNALLEAIHKIILDADKEDCPNGWGS